ncbi:MAG: class I SAM-dependent methyltransferase [Bacteroidales bacterium]|nr:class I SAM-dependent methyltransferase [Bacteroidales bacterium]MCF8334577.1 class I SAM-dependent methyltransferase [Bacteroidales bacterium]
MSKNLFKKNYQIIQFLKYITIGRSIHSTHPPFAYDFYRNILKTKIKEQDKQLIQRIRNKGLRNRNVIEHTDMGAGSGDKEYIRTYKRVSRIVKNTSISNKFGGVLYNLVRHYQPQNILEFGTAAGISTLYLSLPGTENSQLITMEGCAELATVARSNFKKAHVSDNIQLITGNFDSVLPLAMHRMTRIDLAYIDGNHTKKPMLDYFNTLLPKVHNDTIFVFDDIHWSQEMTKVWNTIRNHEQVTLSVDLFRMGIIFFKKELSRQHLILRY